MRLPWRRKPVADVPPHQVEPHPTPHIVPVQVPSPVPPRPRKAKRPPTHKGGVHWNGERYVVDGEDS